MASSKQTQLIAAGAGLLVVGGLYWMQVKKDAATTNTSFNEASKTAAPQVKVVPEEIDKVVLKAKDKPELTLDKKPEGWAMSAPVVSTRTQKSAIDEVLNGLKGVTFKEPIAKGANYYAEYDLTPEKAVHVVASKGGVPVIDLWLGAQKSRGQMARVGNDDQIWSITGANAFTFDKAPKDFRDRKVWDLARDQVAAVTVHDGKGTFAFTKNETADADAGAGATDASADAGAGKPAWNATLDGKPLAGAEASKIDELINAFAMGGVLNADDFGDGKSDVETGLAAPDATALDFKTKDGASHKLVLGKTEGTKRYARKEGDPTVYLLAESPSSWAEAGPDKFATVTAGDAGAGDAGKGDAKK